MGTGYLIVNVYADNIAQPVEGAIVSLTGDKANMKEKTDINGKTKKLSLACPGKEYSLNYQRVVKPYASYNIKVEKSGLRTVIIEGIEIFDGTTAIQNVYMQSSPSEYASDQYINIPPHALWGDYPPKIQVDTTVRSLKALSDDSSEGPDIPGWVIVHDGLPSDDFAANYRIPFSDYIKNVASSELYATWPREALCANIYAILSFTGNRIYSKWYKSQGYAFTITSSSQFDQKFVYGRNIYKEISDIVDNVLDKYIKRNTKSIPFFAQYSDGKETNNTGWLSKWGSKDLADKGYSAIQIIRYYYGDNFSIDTAKAEEDTPNSFPGYNITEDIRGGAVQKIQLKLNVIRSAYPDIPAINPPDGEYGSKTKEVVLLFQKIFDMPQTGIVDFPTWHRISYVYAAVSKALQERYIF